MKEEFMVLAKVRLENAKECLKEAETLLSDELYKGANNRAFYAIEKAVKALLAMENLEVKTHNGALKQFNQYFIHDGDGYFTEEDYRNIASADQIRNASDYNDFYIVKKEESRQQVEYARILVKKVENYINKIKE